MHLGGTDIQWKGIGDSQWVLSLELGQSVTWVSDSDLSVL